MKRALFCVVAVQLLIGCGSKEIRYAVNIVTQTCQESADPLKGVQYVQVRVSGEGMELKTELSPVNPGTRELQIPQIPAGKDRIVEVRGYDADPSAGGKVLSVGRSQPFEVPKVLPEEETGPTKLNLIMRRVNMFAPVVSAAAPSQCQHLRVPRAGHTATLLKDGRVYIAGGFALTGDSTKKELKDAEMFNPATGAFELTKALSVTAQGMSYDSPRAYHTATLLPSGQVVVWGGEKYVDNVPVAIGSIVVYDPQVDDYARAGPQSPIARSRHSAAIDSNGKVLIVGGIRGVVGGSAQLVEEVEWMDPSSNQYSTLASLMLPRIDASLTPVKKGELLALAGGSDGTALKAELTLFKFTGSTFAQQSISPPTKLLVSRRNAVGISIREGADLLLFGGYDSASQVHPVASSELLNGTAVTMAAGPVLSKPRGDSCAVALGKNQLLVTGGRTAETGGATRSEASSDLFTVAETGSIAKAAGPDLPQARYHHTCTTLKDGSVLVTGGIFEQVGGAIQVLEDAYIYTPAPDAD